jgi:hypothetical protein
MQALASATSLDEQIKLVAELDALDYAQRTATTSQRSLDWAETTVGDTLAPVATFDRHTASSDWLAAADTRGDDHHQRVIAEASLWFQRLDPDVKADAHEFVAQARGIARRTAGRYGEAAEQAEGSFLQYVGFLNRQVLAASGLDQVQQRVDSFENPKPTPLNAEVFDNFAPPVHPINTGIDGTQQNSLAPGAEEAMSESGGSGVGRPSEHEDEPEGYLGPQQGGYPPASAKEGALAPPSMAIGYTYSLDDFLRTEAAGDQDLSSEFAEVPDTSDEQDAARMNAEGSRAGGAAPFVGKSASKKDPDDDGDDDTTEKGDTDNDRQFLPKQGASGLPQVQQVTDVHDQPAQTSLPTDVMFPVVQPWPEQEADYDQGGETQQGGTGTPSRHESVRKQADMYGASDQPHAAPGTETPVANSAQTTPPRANEGDYSKGVANGQADAQAGNKPSFADNSSNLSDYVRGYVQGYGNTPVGNGGPQDIPGSMGGDSGQGMNFARTEQGREKPLVMAKKKIRLSASLLAKDVGADEDFQRGYRYASRWKPGTELVSLGSSGEEAGIYAGITDNPGAQMAWVHAHREGRREHPELADRMRSHHRVTSNLRKTRGRDLAIKGLYVQAATSLDLDTMSPNTNPDPTGATPFSGPGTVPPLRDAPGSPADPGGPAPYNGAEPTGSPVVSDPAIQDLTGGPRQVEAPQNVDLSGDSSLMNRSPQVMGRRMPPEALAFRKTVQAAKLALRQQKNGSN